MKNLTILIIVILSLITINHKSHAQSGGFAIKTGLLEPFTSSFNLSTEVFAIEKYLSLQVGATITSREIGIWESLGANASGWSFELQPRYYFEYFDYSNFYIGATGSYTIINIEADLPDANVNLLSGNSILIGIIGGWQREIVNNFYVDFTLGPAYHLADYNGRLSDRGKIIPRIINNGFLPKIDIKLAYFFGL